MLLTKELGFKSSQGQESFLHSLTSRLALVSIQPFILWVHWAFSVGAKWLGCETDRTFPSGAKIKNVWGCSTAPIHLYGLCSIKRWGNAALFMKALFGKNCRWPRVRQRVFLPLKWCVCDVAGVPPLCHHLQGVTHHYTTIITDPYQRLQNNQMQMVEMLDASLHSRG
jgi:hypothetical protein